MSFAGRLFRRITGKQKARRPFAGSGEYWEARYASGGNSGAGSYDKFAEFKAEILNSFVEANDIASVIEFGCGDGNQLELASYEKYLGLDVSEAALALCRKKFAADPGKSFKSMAEYDGENADLALSLDVIYHLVEDEIFTRHVRALFAAARRFVVIYSSNTDEGEAAEVKHVRHRKFTRWIDENIQGWQLRERLPNRYPYTGDYKTGSFADFYIYERV